MIATSQRPCAQESKTRVWGGRGRSFFVGHTRTFRRFRQWQVIYARLSPTTISTIPQGTHPTQPTMTQGRPDGAAGHTS